MKTFIVYDSNFGNTQLVAEEIAKSLVGEVTLSHVKQFDKTKLAGIDLLILGCPINNWNPTESTMNFLNTLEKGSLTGLKFATFDTRVKLFHGDAMNKTSNMLKNAGATCIVPPKSFSVTGTKGPLFPGELEKAAEWAKEIVKAVE